MTAQNQGQTATAAWLYREGVFGVQLRGDEHAAADVVEDEAVLCRVEVQTEAGGIVLDGDVVRALSGVTFPAGASKGIWETGWTGSAPRVGRGELAAFVVEPLPPFWFSRTGNKLRSWLRRTSIWRHVWRRVWRRRPSSAARSLLACWLKSTASCLRFFSKARNGDRGMISPGK